nr:hypothetical protein [Tanacetum cinerariifolium]
MSKQCTKPKRKRDDLWFKDKLLLVQAQVNDQIIHEDELAFLVDPGIAEDAFTEVHNPDNVDNNMINQGNTKKDKIQRPPSSTQKNKVEAYPRTVKSSLKNKNYVVEPKETATMQHSKVNANSELICVKCHGCIISDNHDLCVLNAINDVNARSKSKSAKKNIKRKVWKPTGKAFTKTRYTWRPTGCTFTIVGNACLLTRITTTAGVLIKKPTDLKNDSSKPIVTLVYSKKPRKSKTTNPVSKSKVV